jgi:hypothetical protein
MFVYHSSPDGHFGLAEDVCKLIADNGSELCCPACGARYRLLERLDPTGRSISRI